MSLGEVAARRDLDLALAVIAEAAGLQHRGAAERGRGGFEIGQRVDGPEGRNGETEFGDEALLAEAVLRHGQRPRAGMQRDARAKEGRCRGRDVLEFVGHHIDGIGEAGERLLVLILRDGVAGRDVEGRAVGLGREDMAADAEIGGGEGHHPGELAAAEDAEHGAGREAGRNGRVHASSRLGRSAMPALWRAR